MGGRQEGEYTREKRQSTLTLKDSRRLGGQRGGRRDGARSHAEEASRRTLINNCSKMCCPHTCLLNRDFVFLRGGAGDANVGPKMRLSEHRGHAGPPHPAPFFGFFLSL